MGDATGVMLRNAGFSLIEMVVAVAIMAMSLGALYQASGGATRTMGMSEKSAYAVELARSLRDLHAVVPPEGTNAQGRTDGGFSWSVSVTPWDVSSESPLEPWQLQRLQVEVRWQDGARERSFALESVAVGREDAKE